MADSKVSLGIDHPTSDVGDGEEPLGRDAILVTGGAGFIGSNFCAYMMKQENEFEFPPYVISMDDLSHGTLDNLPDDPHIQPVVGDVTDDVTPGSQTAEWLFGSVDTVVHLAAESSTKMHGRDPQGGARTNVEGFVNIMECCLEHGVSNVVYASSSTVYGNPDTPTSEDHPLNPTTRYAASKASRERYAEAYRELGLNVVGLRFFSTYQGYRYREGHKGEHGNIISQFAEKIHNGESPVIYGDGTQTRDFVHVHDTVRAIEAAIGLNGIYNVCTGKAERFNTVAHLLSETLGREDIEPEYVEPQVDGEYVDTQRGDPSKLCGDTDWEPEIDLQEGIRRVCAPYVE